MWDRCRDAARPEDARSIDGRGERPRHLTIRRKAAGTERNARRPKTDGPYRFGPRRRGDWSGAGGGWSCEAWLSSVVEGLVDGAEGLVDGGALGGCACGAEEFAAFEFVGGESADAAAGVGVVVPLAPGGVFGFEGSEVGATGVGLGAVPVEVGGGVVAGSDVRGVPPRVQPV